MTCSLCDPPQGPRAPGSQGPRAHRIAKLRGIALHADEGCIVRPDQLKWWRIDLATRNGTMYPLGNLMGISWEYHGNLMRISWEYTLEIMGLQWLQVLDLPPETSSATGGRPQSNILMSWNPEMGHGASRILSVVPSGEDQTPQPQVSSVGFVPFYLPYPYWGCLL